MARINYKPEFERKLIKLYIEYGRTLTSLSEKYIISKSTITEWIKKYREKCNANSEIQTEKNYFQETLKLKLHIEELEKENRFLKKAVAFFTKEIT